MAPGGRRGKSGSDMAGRGGRGGQQQEVDRKKRSVFTKLLKDKNAQMRDVYQAKRFIEGMETFDSKAELLAKLQDDREEGMRRVRDLLSFINSIHDVETLFIPLLRLVMTEETSRPVYRPLRDKMLLAIYHTPGLWDALDGQNVAQELEDEEAKQLCSFLRALTKPYIEPRQSERVRNLAKALRERGDTDEARILCRFLLLDESEKVLADRQAVHGSKPKRAKVACWVTDMEPPGGRHDNDHLNYRDIRVIPTVEELTCGEKPYLPLASGENNFIEDPVARLLDRNFRLLREDAISSMKTNLAEAETKGWKNARIIDIYASTKRPRFSVSFVVQFDNRPGRQFDWKRAKALMHGSVVAFCQAARPVRLGTIVVREDTVVKEWLNDPHGPKIGVMFESDGEFGDSVKEMVKNCAWNERYCKLKKVLADLGQKDPKRLTLNEQIQACAGQLVAYDLVEVSKSFFAYQPILKTLQEMDSVPFSEELAGSGHVSARPEYLPDEISLPERDFGGYKCNFSNWSLDDIVERTTLDRSQARALEHSLTSRVVLTQGPPGTPSRLVRGVSLVSSSLTMWSVPR
jgi:hypothetical protein